MCFSSHVPNMCVFLSCRALKYHSRIWLWANMCSSFKVMYKRKYISLKAEFWNSLNACHITGCLHPPLLNNNVMLNYEHV